METTTHVNPTIEEKCTCLYPVKEPKHLEDIIHPKKKRKGKAELTNSEAALELKFMSSSRRRTSEEPLYELLRKSTKRVDEGAFPAFFDFSDYNIRPIKKLSK